jgi:phosphoribosylformimino-5-aminoimidazole carboxamide ribotide isomerase
MGGLVVHARFGDRAHYQPIRSRLCESPRIEDVVSGLLDLHAFRHLYVADLDALLGRPQQLSALDAVRRIAPGLVLWIDAGIRTGAQLSLIGERGTPVLATEKLTPHEAEGLLAACPVAVLSVDYRGERALGDPVFLDRLVIRPTHIIVMNLARVGSGQGPDLPLIEALRPRAPTSRWYAAGGVRDALDLQQCRAAGVAGVLVASALHDGRISRADLDSLSSQPSP